jgi:hypothetical protein
MQLTDDVSLRNGPEVARIPAPRVMGADQPDLTAVNLVGAVRDPVQRALLAVHSRSRRRDNSNAVDPDFALTQRDKVAGDGRDRFPDWSRATGASPCA